MGSGGEDYRKGGLLWVKSIEVRSIKGEEF
jgi:hypothetical protein